MHPSEQIEARYFLEATTRIEHIGRRLRIIRVRQSWNNIIGDGILNKPQSTRIWDQGMRIIAIVVISVLTAIYSGIKILR